MTLKRKIRLGDFREHPEILGTDLVTLELRNPSLSVFSNEDLTFHKDYDSKQKNMIRRLYGTSPNIGH